MICYRDMTFCADAERCANKETCQRWLSPKEVEAATRWWGDAGFPVAMSHFAFTCEKYEEKK